MASVYATASDHEGLAVPPLEARSFGLPVIARDAGALRETIDGAGIVLPAGAPPTLMAEAIAEAATNQALRRQLQRRGLGRVEAVERRAGRTDMMTLLAAKRLR
jgi:glycosyltransferase involved in cell wall biosynthesis